MVHIDQSKFTDTVALEEISETSWIANAGAVRSSAKTLLVPAQLRPRESVDKSVHAKVSSPTLKLLESHGDYFLPRRLPLFPFPAARGNFPTTKASSFLLPLRPEFIPPGGGSTETPEISFARRGRL